MYSIIMDQLKTQLETKVNVHPIQVGYLGDFLEINFIRAAVLLEPKTDSRTAKNIRWKDGIFDVTLWIMNEISRDYMTSMRELEDLLETETDPNALDPKHGVLSALNMLKEDDTFTSLSGQVGQRSWRIGPKVLDAGNVNFGISQRGAARINTVQVELTVYVEVEK
jgi:hypothetical protein